MNLQAENNMYDQVNQYRDRWSQSKTKTYTIEKNETEKYWELF